MMLLNNNKNINLSLYKYFLVYNDEFLIMQMSNCRKSLEKLLEDYTLDYRIMTAQQIRELSWEEF